MVCGADLDYESEKITITWMALEPTWPERLRYRARHVASVPHQATMPPVLSASLSGDGHQRAEGRSAVSTPTQKFGCKSGLLAGGRHQPTEASGQLVTVS